MRTFIAIDINDDELIKKIYELSLAVKRTGASLKLVEPENLHITLKFLGEIDPKDIDIIKKVIEIAAALTLAYSDAKNEKEAIVRYGKRKLNKSIKISSISEKTIEKLRIK